MQNIKHHILIPADADAISAFVALRGVTRCPTACVSHTMAVPPLADRLALAEHFTRQEQARGQRIARFLGADGFLGAAV